MASRLTMKSLATFILSVLCTLTCLSVDAFYSAGVVKPLSGKNVLFVPEAREGHFRKLSSTELVNQNAFSKSSPSITSFYWLSSPSTQYTDTSLASFQIRPFSRSSETATSESTSESRTQRSSPIITATSSIKNGLTTAPQSAVQSLASLELTSTATRKLKKYASRSISSLPLSEVVDQVSQTVLKYWWTLPTFLALVPLYTTFVLQAGDATMPHWWPVTRMDDILKSSDAAMVIGCFLFSNIAYFASGFYLLKKFPFITSPTSVDTNTSTSSNSVISTVALNLKRKASELRMVPTRQTWLGLLMLVSGLISTIFHTEQALGSYAMANSLCYLDHAVAGTSTFYYFHTCDLPSKKVWVLGIAGLAALSIPHPAYAWLHSSWHFLSAAAATLWALESFDETYKAACRSNPAQPMVEAITIPETARSHEEDGLVEQ